MSNIVSVVIPVKNRAKLVTRVLESLRLQSAPSFDTVLVDNDSADGTLRVLQDWAEANGSAARRVRVLRQPVPGAAAARNAGLEAVDTPWVLFFDSDDVMLPAHMQRVLSGIADNPHADILGWNIMCKGIGIRRFSVSNPLWCNLFEGNFATLRWAARTEFVRRAGGWNKAMTLWDDIELGARMLALKPVMAHLGNEITVEVYPQAQSISTNSSGDYLNRIEAPLQSIAGCLPQECRIWTDYVRMIVAGNTYCAANSAEVRERAATLAGIVAGRAPTAAHRVLLRAVYYFRRVGGRGQNRLLRPLLSHGNNK